MNPLAKDIAAICRMQIELVKANSAVLFPGQPLADVLDLHFVLLHLFLADAEGRQLSVSELARVMGLSRATVRHKLAKLVKMGQCTNGDEGYALSHDRDMAVLRKLLAHKAKIITAASKEVADLAASNGRAELPGGSLPGTSIRRPAIRCENRWLTRRLGECSP